MGRIDTVTEWFTMIAFAVVLMISSWYAVELLTKHWDTISGWRTYWPL